MKIRFTSRFLRNGKQRFIAFLILFTLMLFPCEMIYSKTDPILAECACAAASTELSETVSAVASEFEFGSLVSYDDPDRLYTDVTAVNSIKSDFAKKLTDSLKNGKIRISVPLGDIIGHPSTLGRGPRVPIKLSGFTSAVTDIKSDFISAGINQTLHRISMTVTLECTLILPRFRTEKLTETITVPLSEVVIVGNVPSYYR
ncbi:MAG: sporulation protein YunB [Clostridia bacterium]|nr:sporulation protein YunB [Clostridia bacterium]